MGLVTVRVLDHLPVYAFVGGVGGMREEERGCLGSSRVVNQEMVEAFVQKLVEWDWRVLQSLSADENVARFRNEFRGLYYGSFPVANCRKWKKNLEKSWLDDLDFKQLLEEKGDLYSRKLWGQVMEEGGQIEGGSVGGEWGSA